MNTIIGVYAGHSPIHHRWIYVAITLSFLGCVETPAAAIAFILVMSVITQRPRRQYTVWQWGHFDLQEYANDSFVSNNNIFTILFLQHLLSQTNK